MSYKPYTLSQGVIGTSVFTLLGVTAAPLFVPRIEYTATPNRTKTNIKTIVNITFPITATVDGLEIQRALLRGRFEFDAVQTITATSEKTRVLDEMIAFLTEYKVAIVNGSATKPQV